LTRTSWDGPVSGVCGGVARYLGVDPTLVRVLAAVTMVVTFPVGVIVYAVMWAVIPKE
jgi:phage shock protein PspC (stress-responsive transcriptional regulator)